MIIIRSNWINLDEVPVLSTFTTATNKSIVICDKVITNKIRNNRYIFDTVSRAMGSTDLLTFIYSRNQLPLLQQ